MKQKNWKPEPKKKKRSREREREDTDFRLNSANPFSIQLSQTHITLLLPTLRFWYQSLNLQKWNTSCKQTTTFPKYSILPLVRLSSSQVPKTWSSFVFELILLRVSGGVISGIGKGTLGTLLDSLNPLGLKSFENWTTGVNFSFSPLSLFNRPITQDVRTSSHSHQDRSLHEYRVRWIFTWPHPLPSITKKKLN